MEIGIIGGGASGMFLASMLKNKKVYLLDKNQKLGKKLLLTGNGKCNFTNDDFFDLDLIYNNDLAKNVYIRHDKDAFLRYLDEIGILPKIEVHHGKKYYYPNSNKAISVYYALYDKMVDNGVNIIYDCDIYDVKYDSEKFEVSSKTNKYIFDKLVIATGGMTYKQTGSDGSMYKIIEKLGHHINKPIKALCGFGYDDIDLKKIKGVRVDAKVIVKTDAFDFIEFGEVQFTENGISGIPIMNLSRKVNRLLDKGEKISLHIDFMYDTENVVGYLTKRRENLYYKNSEDFLCGIIPDELANLVIKRSGLKNIKVAKISDDTIKKIAKNLSDFTINDIFIPSIDNAQITLGGVDTKEINDNLESKFIKNLYFIGEVIDIDGPCGGYNLQLTYSTAAEVANNI